MKGKKEKREGRTKIEVLKAQQRGGVWKGYTEKTEMKRAQHAREGKQKDANKGMVKTMKKKYTTRSQKKKKRDLC